MHVWGIPPDILKGIANGSKKESLSIQHRQTFFQDILFILTTHACMFCSFEGGPWSILSKCDTLTPKLVQG